MPYRARKHVDMHRAGRLRTPGSQTPGVAHRHARLGRGSDDVAPSGGARASQLCLRRRLGLHGPDRARRGRAAVDVLTAFRALLRDICARRGVRIAKWLGDGVMLVCVTTQPLLAAILELHYVVCEVSGPVQSVSIRSGITSGDVILMEGDDYVGHCVNVAARLCDLAQGGEALAAPSVVSELPRWGAVLTHKEVALRGVEKPVPTSRIGMAAVGAGRSRDPICGLPMYEATAEETAEDADGGLVLFCSPAGLHTWCRRPSGPTDPHLGDGSSWLNS